MRKHAHGAHHVAVGAATATGGEHPHHAEEGGEGANASMKRQRRAQAERDRRAKIKAEEETLKVENAELKRERDDLLRRLDDVERELAGAASASEEQEDLEEVHTRTVLDIENVLLKAQLKQYELFVRAVRRVGTGSPYHGIPPRQIIPTPLTAANQAAHAAPGSVASASSATMSDDEAGNGDGASSSGSGVDSGIRTITQDIAIQTMHVAWSAAQRLLASSKWRRLEWSKPALAATPRLSAEWPGSAFVTSWRQAADKTWYLRGDAFVVSAPMTGVSLPHPHDVRDAWHSVWLDEDATAQVNPLVRGAGGGYGGARSGGRGRRAWATGQYARRSEERGAEGESRGPKAEARM